MLFVTYSTLSVITFELNLFFTKKDSGSGIVTWCLVGNTYEFMVGVEKECIRYGNDTYKVHKVRKGLHIINTKSGHEQLTAVDNGSTIVSYEELNKICWLELFVSTLNIKKKRYILNSYDGAAIVIKEMQDNLLFFNSCVQSLYLWYYYVLERIILFSFFTWWIGI